ncbi:Imm1 family immunity protein [Kitasatospora sp. NPDC127111]|uniref:Imm1 family immunity protein n=1 Tax=Kitasatospora sp. NPDC127111 TaxID=3345363 RepID=UPI003637C37B
MILIVIIGDERLYGESEGDAERLISRAMESLEFGDNAWLSIDDRRREAGSYASNSLKVSINRSTGYGGVIWQVSTSYPKQGGIYAHTWVSDNPEPPTTDPKVLSDVHHPVFMEAASALPVAEIRKVLEEFYRAGIGDRPTCINWVRGHMNGEREERGPGVEPAPESSTDVEAVLGDIMKFAASNDSVPD